MSDDDDEHLKTCAWSSYDIASPGTADLATQRLNLPLSPILYSRMSRGSSHFNISGLMLRSWNLGRRTGRLIHMCSKDGSAHGA
jgi:hypothetical protein